MIRFVCVDRTPQVYKENSVGPQHTSEANMAFRHERVGEPLEDRHAALERALIAEFLAGAGQTLMSLRTLPEPQRDDLMRFAATYATLKLSEIESRAEYVHGIHGSSH